MLVLNPTSVQNTAEAPDLSNTKFKIECINIIQVKHIYYFDISNCYI